MLLAHTRSMLKPRLVLDSERKAKRNVNVLTWEIATIGGHGLDNRSSSSHILSTFTS